MATPTRALLRRRFPISTSCVRRYAGAWVLLLAAWSAAHALPAISTTGGSFHMPIAPERLIYRLGSEAPPAVLEFWREHGREWNIYWDSLLDTPRAVYPLEPVPVVTPELLDREADPAALTSAVEAFVDGLSSFLGIDTSRLAEPYIHRAPPGSELRHAIFVFQQTTPSGLPVRGANLRVIVLGDGTLGGIKAFIGKGIEDPRGPVVTEEQVVAAANQRGRVLDPPQLFVGFRAGSLDSAAALWRIDMEDTVEPYSPVLRTSEHIIDAATSELLARLVVVKHFGGQGGAEELPVTGTVIANVPQLRDIFASPAREETRLPNAVRGLAIRKLVVTGPGDPLPVPVAVTAEDGSFAFSESTRIPRLTVHAALDWGHIEPDPRAVGGAQWLSVSQVRPFGLGVTLPLLPGSGEGDVDDDGVPDWTIVGEPGDTMAFAMNQGTATHSQLSRDRAHWLLCFEAARSVTSSTERELKALFDLGGDTLRAAPHLPVTPVCVIPMPAEPQMPEELRGLNSLQCAVQYSTPTIQCTLPDGRLAALIVVPLNFDVVGDPDGCQPDAGEEPEVLEPIVPTVVQHEVGHHVFFHMTNTKNGCIPDLCQQFLVGIEDGVADAVTAFVNNRPEIGYRYDDNGNPVPTPRGFSLASSRPGGFRLPVRKELAEGFWELREELSQPDEGQNLEPEPATAHQILLAWLDMHRVAELTQISFSVARDLLVDLRLVNQIYWPTLSDRRRAWHRRSIDRAFGRRYLFDEAPFIRGDADLNQRLDISDPVVIFNVLFRGEGEMHDCRNAMDADNNGAVEITDAIRLLGFLFLGTDPPPFPFDRGCGYDSDPPNEIGNLGCREYSCPK